jgi:hypothetical protein
MRSGYVFVGAIVLLTVAAGVSMLPDFVRYIKIRSM